MAVTYDYKGKYATGIGIMIGGFTATFTTTNGSIALPCKRIKTVLLQVQDVQTNSVPLWTQSASATNIISVRNVATGAKVNVLFVGV